MNELSCFGKGFLFLYIVEADDALTHWHIPKQTESNF